MSIRPLPVLAVLSLVSASPALASSEDAWKQFAADVQDSCLSASTQLVNEAQIVVDPFGTEHYGVAIIAGKAPGADAQISLVCVYNKETKTAEVSQGFDAETIGVTIPEISPQQ